MEAENAGTGEVEGGRPESQDQFLMLPQFKASLGHGTLSQSTSTTNNIKRSVSFQASGCFLRTLETQNGEDPLRRGPKSRQVKSIPLLSSGVCPGTSCLQTTCYVRKMNAIVQIASGQSRDQTWVGKPVLIGDYIEKIKSTSEDVSVLLLLRNHSTPEAWN